jgi:hypothetical protein
MTARSYRPSNGTEVDIFMSSWCARCREDDRGPEMDGDGCEIVVLTMAYDIGHPDYPKAWVTDERGPRCTAFVALDSADQPIDPAAVVRPLL